MLSASSPITFPKSSPPPAPKRSKPHDEGSKPKARAKGPFIDSDSDDSDDEIIEVRDGEHVAKRPMLQDPRGTSENEQQTHNAGIANVTNEEHTRSQTLPQRPIFANQRPIFMSSVLQQLNPSSYTITKCDGNAVTVTERKETAVPTYESMVAARSKTKEGRAVRSYYGIDIHELMTTASAEIASKPQSRPSEPNAPVQSVEAPLANGKKPKKTLLWTEKYRARNFMDLCGDDGTNRLVLKWLKKWDSLVFPGATRSKPVIARRSAMKQQEEEKPHRKILMLTGPPGLGKTTLAHVCARQAGYDVMEINASDDRSKDVVKGRIRTSLGTESVKTVSNRKDNNGQQKVARPACVIVDEVDGVVTGSGGSGEGGFVKALIDLVLLDQRNTPGASSNQGARKKKKDDDFRLMRPLILICNDVYAPSLRPLRQSNLAEIIHVGKPSIDTVVNRLKGVFEKEGIPCEKDAARKLCEAAWGITSGIDARRGTESTIAGDLRGVMVVGEWVAGRFRASTFDGAPQLTRQWVERNVLQDLTNGAGGARGLGRGSVKDIITRLFKEGCGFPKQALDLSESKTKHEQPKTELGFNEMHKKYGMSHLAQMIETSGEVSTIMTEIFSEYPNREYNDDLYLTKPNQAYDWLHFHDTCQSRLFGSQEWELGQYLSQPALACHSLFASSKRHDDNMGFDKRWGAAQPEDEPAPIPFSGPRADYQAREAEKHNRSQLQIIQAQLPPTLLRSFRSPEAIAAEFLPYLMRMLSPDVKPVVVGGSSGSTASVRKDTEKTMVKRASEVLAEVGIQMQKGKIESESIVNRGAEYVYRMDPDIDALSTFETGASLLLASNAPTRYAVRQVLDQELQRTIALRESRARQARFNAGNAADQALIDDKENAIAAAKTAAAIIIAKDGTMVKKDFFGRVIEARPLSELTGNSLEMRIKKEKEERKVWVTYHEGLNNAVRKPLTLQEFMKGL